MNLRSPDYQSGVLPLNYLSIGEGNGARTRDFCIDSAVLYQLNYTLMVSEEGIEPSIVGL